MEPAQPDTCLPPATNAGVSIRHFQESVSAGKHWYIALLESIGLWTDESEDIEGQKYQYLIAGEAFDWLLLAERISETADGLVPENEKLALLFQGRPPLRLSSNEFKNLIGAAKYRQYLNYFYGVTVEEALVQAVCEEVRKERRSNGLRYRHDEEDETFLRVYGETESVLLGRFRREKRYPKQTSSNLAVMKEFTYWRFKYRLKVVEKAKVASDTRKALEWLKKNGLHYPFLTDL